MFFWLGNFQQHKINFSNEELPHPQQHGHMLHNHRCFINKPYHLRQSLMNVHVLLQYLYYGNFQKQDTQMVAYSYTKLLSMELTRDGYQWII